MSPCLAAGALRQLAESKYGSVKLWCTGLPYVPPSELARRLVDDRPMLVSRLGSIEGSAVDGMRKVSRQHMHPDKIRALLKYWTSLRSVHLLRSHAGLFFHTNCEAPSVLWRFWHEFTSALAESDLESDAHTSTRSLVACTHHTIGRHRPLLLSRCSAGGRSMPRPPQNVLPITAERLSEARTPNVRLRLPGGGWHLPRPTYQRRCEVWCPPDLAS